MSGTAVAQTSLVMTGKYAGGYETQKISGVKTGGLGTDTAAIKLSAIEDLGGGLTAAASVSIGGMARGSITTGEDASVSLSGAYGTFALRSFESAGQGITARAAAGTPGYDLHGRVFSSNVNVDGAFFTFPKFGDVTFGLSYVDRGTVDEYGDELSNGLNAGSKGVASAQPSVGVSAGYKTGAIDAGIDFTSWTRQGDVQVTKPYADNRVRISGNYDFGFAKFGAGYSKTDRTGALKSTTETLIGLSTPIGAMTIGATYGESKGNAESSTAKKTGYTLGAQYDLSKRTNMGVSSFSYKTVGSQANTGFRALVAHTF